jgi:hypothetical protein
MRRLVFVPHEFYSNPTTTMLEIVTNSR